MPQKKPTNWLGWVYFASAMMLLAGGMHIIAGLVALFQNDYYLVAEKSVLAFSYTQWGWIHLIGGIIVLFAGLAVGAGRTWGRIIGVLMAVVSALLNLAFLSSYPIWSIMIIVIDVFVIYALTIHGAEARE